MRAQVCAARIPNATAHTARRWTPEEDAILSVPLEELKATSEGLGLLQQRGLPAVRARLSRLTKKRKRCIEGVPTAAASAPAAAAETAPSQPVASVREFFQHLAQVDSPDVLTTIAMTALAHSIALEGRRVVTKLTTASLSADHYDELKDIATRLHALAE